VSKASRNKGQRGEREVCKLLAEKLGGEFKRNLMQTAEGGYDVIGLEGCALEVKRCETLSINSWWDQAKEQAEVNAWPVLFYRKSRQPWSVVIEIGMANKQPATSFGHDRMTVDVDTFIKIYKWRSVG